MTLEMCHHRSDELVGIPMVLRYVGRLGALDGKPAVYGADPLAACQVDQWLEVSAQVVPGQGFEGVCSSIDKYLALRTFLAGYALTVADFAIWGQLQGEWMLVAVSQSTSAQATRPSHSRAMEGPQCWSTSTNSGQRSRSINMHTCIHADTHTCYMHDHPCLPHACSCMLHRGQRHACIPTHLVHASLPNVHAANPHVRGPRPPMRATI